LRPTASGAKSVAARCWSARDGLQVGPDRAANRNPRLRLHGAFRGKRQLLAAAGILIFTRLGDGARHDVAGYFDVREYRLQVARFLELPPPWRFDRVSGSAALGLCGVENRLHPEAQNYDSRRAAAKGTPIELDMSPVVQLFASCGGAPRLLIEVDI